MLAWALSLPGLGSAVGLWTLAVLTISAFAGVAGATWTTSVKTALVKLVSAATPQGDLAARSGGRGGAGERRPEILRKRDEARARRERILEVDRVGRVGSCVRDGDRVGEVSVRVDRIGTVALVHGEIGTAAGTLVRASAAPGRRDKTRTSDATRA